MPLPDTNDATTVHDRETEAAPAETSRGMEMAPDVEGQDLDSMALAAAQAALDGGEQTTEGQAQDPAPESPAAPKDQETAPAKGGVPDMIPKARFDEAVGKLREELAFVRGQVDQLSRQPASTTPAASDQPQVDPTKQRISELQALIVDAESRHEAAEISSAEKAAIIADITTQIAETMADRKVEDALREERSRNSGNVLDQEIEARHAAKLEGDHPYLLVITDEQMGNLRERAIAMAKIDGKPFRGGQADDLRLREEIARLSDLYGPSWHPDADVRRPTSATPTPAVPGKPLSPKAAAAAKKVDLANRMPPDIRNLGTSVSGESPLNEAAIMAMSDVDLENLTPKQRAAALQGA